MNILLVESRYEDSEDLEELYNSFTDADVDVYSPGELDFEEMRDQYDVVLSELYPGDGFMGPDLLDRFEADRKGIYTVWQEGEAQDEPEVSDAMAEYDVINKPGSLNLEALAENKL